MKTLRCWGMNGLAKAVSFVNDKQEWREGLRKSPSPESIELSTLQFSKTPVETRTFHENSVSDDFLLVLNFLLIYTVIAHSYRMKCGLSTADFFTKVLGLAE